MNGFAPFRTTQDAAGMLAALLPLMGIRSGVDADLVRGRSSPSDTFTFDPKPTFTPPPGFGEIVGQYTFGG